MSDIAYYFLLAICGFVEPVMVLKTIEKHSGDTSTVHAQKAVKGTVSCALAKKAVQAYTALGGRQYISKIAALSNAMLNGAMDKAPTLYKSRKGSN